MSTVVAPQVNHSSSVPLGGPLKNSARNLDVYRERNVDLDPQPGGIGLMIAGAVVPIGLAIAATVATSLASTDRVAIAAWVSVSVVGTASVIAAAAASRRRTLNTVTDKSRSMNKDESLPDEAT